MSKYKIKQLRQVNIPLASRAQERLGHRSALRSNASSASNLAGHANGRFREGFRMPAWRERSTRDEGSAAESLRRTNPRESGERLAVYGDLARQRLWREMVFAGSLRESRCARHRTPGVLRLETRINWFGGLQKLRASN